MAREGFPGKRVISTGHQGGGSERMRTAVKDFEKKKKVNCCGIITEIP